MATEAEEVGDQMEQLTKAASLSVAAPLGGEGQ